MEKTLMTPTLEKAIDLAHNLPADDQERIGQELLAIVEKQQIFRDLEERDAEGGEIPLDEVFGELRATLKSRYGL